jgi:putative endopeptidase
MKVFPRFVPALLALALVASAHAQTSPPPTQSPLTELPYTPSLEPAFMDRSVDPCVDFYAYSCNGWMARNPIPADRASWSVYGKLSDENQQYLWGILERAARPDAARDADRQKIGDYFAACTDVASVDRAGLEPIRAELDAIAGLASKAEIAALAGRLHLGPVDRGLLFGFGADQDPGDATQVIAFATSGGLGLPDRDYYLKDDARSAELREKYRVHVRRTFELLGRTADRAEAAAAVVMRIETALARATLTQVERRDPYKVYHRMPLAELQKATPSFAWADYLRAAGAPGIDVLNVTEPAFFAEVEARLAGESLADLQTYLARHLVRGASP